MNMFGLEGSGFIIAISVSLLLIGAVVYYFNTRVASLEKALVRQNQVLADFIQNVKATHMENRAMQNQEMEGNGATIEAVQAAKNYYSNVIPHDKVPVSENDFGADENTIEETMEDSDDDSELESESGSELDSDDEEVDSNELESLDHELLNVHVTTHPHAMLGSMIIDMTGPGPVDSNPNPNPNVIELLDDGDDEDDKSDNLTPVEIKEEPLNSLEPKIIKLSEVEDLDSVSSSLGSSLGDDDEDEDDGITLDSKQETLVADFSKLKVKNLKEIAAKKGIKNASKMKKAELVAALEANK